MMKNRYDFLLDGNLIFVDKYYIVDTYSLNDNSLNDFQRPAIIDHITYTKEEWFMFGVMYLNHIKMIVRRYNDDFSLYDSEVWNYIRYS